MATNITRMSVSRDAVFDVLADGWNYTNWVVGTSHMRAVDPLWPLPGTKLFHAVGSWPLMVRDETQVDAVEPGRRLELTARGRPFGSAKVVLELDDVSDGRECRVTMHEWPISGPGKWLHNPAAEALLVRRNTESLARLTALCERRADPAQ